jgi:hypothetical protein
MGLNYLNGIYSADEQQATVFKQIPKSDVKHNPFFAYKQWISYSGSATNLALPLTAIYSKSTTKTGLPDLVTTGVRRTNPITGVPMDNIPRTGIVPYDNTRNIDGSLQILTYHALNNLIYKRKHQPYNTIGGTNLNNTKKELYQSASILSFPYVTVGEGIKPESFTFDIPNTLSLKSDKYGNIYDTTIDTSSFVSDVMFYEGFNRTYDPAYITSINPLFEPNITYQQGMTTSTGAEQAVGMSARFNGTASTFYGVTSSDAGPFKTKQYPLTISGDYSNSYDHAISFFISQSVDMVTTPRTIIGLDSIQQYPVVKYLPNAPTIYDPVLRAYIRDPSYTMWDLISNAYFKDYPFHIEIVSGSKIRYTMSSKPGTVHYFTSITSSISPIGWTHIVCQKTGSNMELYINGILNATGSASNWLNIPGNKISKKYNQLFIGTGLIQVPAGGNSNYHRTLLNGSLDEIRIFNKAISIAEITSLGNRDENGTFLQTAAVGTVFHKHGLAVISSPHYKYNDLLNTNYVTTHKSTKRLYELNVLARIQAGEFNMSMNPSMLTSDNTTYAPFVTGSNFSPYITTIGLYDPHGRLLAVGKLGQAIKKRDDVDMNFVIRIDLDAPIS